MNDTHPTFINLLSEVSESSLNAYYYDPNFLVSDGSTPLNSSTSHMNGDLMRNVTVVTGNSSRTLAQSVAALLGTHLHNVVVKENSLGEVKVKLGDHVVSKDVYIVHSICHSGSLDVNEALMELLFLIRKMKLGYASNITAIIPFFAYSRQDHKTDLRVPISASMVSGLVTQMGANRVLTVDIHSEQMQGYFHNVPVDNLMMAHEFAHYISAQPWFNADECVVVSPDGGGVERARDLADILKVTRIVTILERHLESGVVYCMETLGEVSGSICILTDDIIDSGRTIVKACDLLKDMGATKIVACCTHGIMTDPCCAKVSECEALDSLLVTDTIPQETHTERCPKLKVLTVAPMLAMSILHNLRGVTITGHGAREDLTRQSMVVN